MGAYLFYMLHARYSGLAGAAAIEDLQRALLGLAQVTGKTSLNPGAVTGALNDMTISAVIAALALAKIKAPDKIPNEVWWILDNYNAIASKGGAGCLLVGLLDPEAGEECKRYLQEAKDFAAGTITQYAPRITLGVKALTLVWPSISGPSTGGRSLLPATVRQWGSQAQQAAQTTPFQEVVAAAPYAIVAYDPAITKYRVAVPKSAAGVFGLGAEVTEKDHVEVGQVNTAPTGDKYIMVSLADYKKLTRKWYQKPLWWAVGAGVLTAGVAGGYYWHKKRA